MYITVHSRYLGSKKPLAGFYHYINIGSFFLMLLDKYGIKLNIRDVFFYQSEWCRGYHGELSNIFDFIFCGYGVRNLWNPKFFSFCHSYLDLSHDFHVQFCFHSHFIFTAHTSLGCRNVS